MYDSQNFITVTPPAPSQRSAKEAQEVMELFVALQQRTTKQYVCNDTIQSITAIQLRDIPPRRF